MNIRKKPKEIMTLIFCTILVGAFFWYVEGVILSFTKESYVYLILLISLLFFVYYFLKKDIERIIIRQNKCEQATWFYYLVYSILLAPLVSVVFALFDAEFVKKSFVFKHGHLHIYNDYSLQFLFIIFNIAVFLIFYFYIKKIENIKIINNDDNSDNFANGAVGLKNDKFNFAQSIPGVVEGIKILNEEVNIVSVDGEYGSGKSSFVRMIVEEMRKDSKNKILYTYLSLTETNETDDFSKLFIERWYETLKKEYPIINTAKMSNSLKGILRESNNNFLSALSSIISSFSFCISRSLNRNTKNELSKDLSMMFGCIEQFKEKSWVFVIDEIDRAKLTEIYRVIEVLERFKLKSSEGFPIKIIFILCFSERELSKYFEQFKRKNELAYLLESFLISDKKSIDLPIFVPPIDYNVKKNYVIELFQGVLKLYSLNYQDIINNKLYFGNFDLIHGFASDEKEMSGAVLGFITKETPRTIKRISNEISFAYGFLRSDIYRFPDLLIMSYVKIKFPILIDFFRKTINLISGYYNDEEIPSMQSYLNFKEYRERKMTVVQYIEAELSANEKEKEILEINQRSIEAIMYIVGSRYCDALNYENPGDINKYRKARSLSYPFFMKNYLQFLQKPKKDYREIYDEIFTKHQNSGVIPEISNEDLLNYADFVKESPDNIKEIMDILSEIVNRIVADKIDRKVCYTGDTIYKSAIYKIIFLVLYLIRTSKDSPEPDSKMQQAFKCLQNVLTSERVTVQAKYSILNSFVNNERGSGSEIHFELNDAFNRLNKYYRDELEKIIKDVMKEYLKYRDKSIYGYEENFFFVLFQSWSGDVDNVKEIEIIREIASNGLANNEDALNLYWAQYSYEEKYDRHIDDFPEYIERDFDFWMKSEHQALYLPLGVLCEITEKSDIPEDIRKKFTFWDKIYKQHKSWVDDKFKLISESTLCSVLINQGFIEKPIFSDDKIDDTNNI